MDTDTYIGVDVSKSWLDFAVTRKRNPNLLKFKFDNNAKGFKELIKALRSNNIVIGRKVLVTLEHTGNYGNVFARYIAKKKCMVCIESALRIKKSLGLQRGKNDSIDLACFAGIAPFEYSSGTVVGKGHVSFYGNKEMKQYLHMGAMGAIRSKNSELRKYYDRKVAEGKHKMLVLNNIRNKILMRAAAVIRRGEPYKEVI